MIKEYRLSRELADQILSTGHLELFREISTRYDINTVVIASTLLQIIPNLRRNEVPVENLSPELLDRIFAALYEGRIAKEALPEVLEKVAGNPSRIDQILEGEILSRDEVVEIISKIVEDNLGIVKERGERAIQPIMGIVMGRLRGKYDGGEIHQIVKAAIEKHL